MGTRQRGLAVGVSARRLFKQVPHVRVNYYASKQCGTSVTASCKIAECPWWLSQTSFPSDVLLLPATLAGFSLTYSSCCLKYLLHVHVRARSRSAPLSLIFILRRVLSIFISSLHLPSYLHFLLRLCATARVAQDFRRHRYLPVNLNVFTLPTEPRFCKRTQSFLFDGAVNSKVAAPFAFVHFLVDTSIVVLTLM